MFHNDSTTLPPLGWSPEELGVSGASNISSTLTSHATRSVAGQVIINASYIIGIIGNLAALCILEKEKKTRYKNRKHALMLKCLAGNDLVALLGMLIQFHVSKELSAGNHVLCVFRVIWRGFGLSSGCVALVMAAERWLALTHPFLYQKRVTYHELLKAIFGCWAVVLVITCMPLFGFGLYYDSETSKCLRYREAKKPIDVAYAYVILTFGLLVCAGIVCANLAVSRFLCHSGHPTKREDFVGRRISRTQSRSVSSKLSGMRVEMINASTPEELAFARLMVALSVTILVCWIPNLLAILLAQFIPECPTKGKSFLEIADVLMAIHFTLDPYIYVLLHHYFPCLKITFDAIQRLCCGFSHSRTPDLLEETTMAIEA